MTPFDDFAYLINHVLLGEEPTIEDFILLVGTLVAFVAFILWCCFPIQPKENVSHRQFSCKSIQHTSSVTAGTQNNYSKNGGGSGGCSGGGGSTTIYNHGLKNGHSYHCCS